MAHQYNRLLSVALDHPWAITRPMLHTVAMILARHLAPEAARAAGLAGGDVEYIPRGRAPEPLATQGVVVIPAHGCIAPRMNMFSDISGGVTFEGLTRDIREAVANKDVGTIVIDWDSPGGSTAGATECAAEILKARDVKRVISHANFAMCSAAYWVGACASEIVASPSSLVGSIGVYTIHEDLSEALKQMGVSVTYISEGKYKVEGNPTEPLSDHARARLQSLIKATYDLFIADVATGRNITAADVRAGYGEGDVMSAAEGLAAGMVDRIEPLSATLARLVSEPAGRNPAPALAAAARRPSLDVEAAFYESLM